MEKRLRPVTYAESLEAKKYAEENDVPMVQEEVAKKESVLEVQRPISAQLIGYENIPSQGKAYPKNGEIYFSPLSFGEMKYLGGSALSDVETAEFFMSKIFTSFPKEDLTYFDFYFLVVMIKLSTFGQVEYFMNFVCSYCGGSNKVPFSTNDLEFESISVDLPIYVDLEEAIELPSLGEIKSVAFKPITIGRFLKQVREGKRSDFDAYMANCIVDGSPEDRLKLIKEVFVGEDVNLLETIDVSFFHGVKDLRFQCTNKVSTEDGREEVCGRFHDLPFQDIVEYITAIDKTKESLRERIHFGIQNESIPEGS